MTEKNYNPEQRKNKAIRPQKIDRKIEIAQAKEEKQEVSASAIDKDIQKKEETEKEFKETPQEKQTKEKKPEKKIKKDEAVVNGSSLPISTKDSVAICKFIKRKSIEKAIEDLEEVLKFKRAIPMKGEIPHRKGKGMMSGRYPIKPVGFFIKMLKELKSNSNINGVDDPIIVEAIPNRAARPYGRFGSVKRKRTHVKIKVIEKSKLKGKKKH